jgi:signal peptidase I
MNNFLIEPPFVPGWAMKRRNSKFFIYNGESMKPLFKPGDILVVRDLISDKVRYGDVVIIRRENRPMGLAENVVHRVIGVGPEYLITKGDNNPNPDTQLVTTENLVGLVIEFERNGHIYKVKGGMLGLFYARIVHLNNLGLLFLKRIGWRFYHLVRQSGMITRFWQPVIHQIYFKTHAGTLIKYCFCNRTVAYWWPETKIFNVAKPFDLVIPHPEGTYPNNTR